MQKKIITNNSPGIGLNLVKLYRYKRLIYTFAVRDIKIQFAQTFLGILWSVLRPLTGLLIYTLFFDFLLIADGADEFAYNLGHLTGCFVQASAEGLQKLSKSFHRSRRFPWKAARIGQLGSRIP